MAIVANSTASPCTAVNQVPTIDIHLGSWPLNPDICNLKFTLNRAGEREIIEAILGGRMEIGSNMK